MEPPLVLVDSSAWIEAIREDGDALYAQELDRLLAGGQAATCEVVVAEILRGTANKAEFAALAEDLGGVIVLRMEGSGEEAGRLAWTLRRQGLTLPTTDLLIAATAHLHGVALLHRDRHLAVAAEALGLQVVEP